MNSLQFFEHKNLPERTAVEWGTGDPQNEKVDQTLSKQPTYYLQNQPITQYYRESNLELSNVRSNDQLMPAAFKEDMLAIQIPRKFPANHPFTSHISFKRVFPNSLPPEHPLKGDAAVNSVLTYNDYTPAQVDHTTVVKKASGKPYRHEIRYQTQPNQANGLWYYDDDYYHVTKPDQTQQYYPAPPTLLVPNPKMRSPGLQIDAATANVLINKDKELMQSSNRIDYYKDGLGTRAPIKSDNLQEKQARFEVTGELDAEMKPYFRRGAGVTQFTAEPVPEAQIEPIAHAIYNENNLLTKNEQDEILMETGKEYQNFPSGKFTDNPSVAAFRMSRSNTMPTIFVNKPAPNRHPNEPNKSAADKQRIDKEDHARKQRIEFEHRRKDIELIRPKEDMRLLNFKYKDLENVRGGAKSNLPQNLKQHVNTLYDQQKKYYGERAELYKTAVYNPYLVKQYVESLKVQPSVVSANFTDGSAQASQKDVYVPNETGKHRPALFAEKTFNDFSSLRRAPLENVLLNPNASADARVQENGFTQEQSTFGASYNTKKFLQENECVSNEETFYRRLHEQEIEAQNTVLKSTAEKVALANYKMGLTDSPADLAKANAVLEKMEKEARVAAYPRAKGPIPPQPYEPIYCAEQITEMSDGNAKRAHGRVYDSPFATQSHARFEPFRADVEAMHAFGVRAEHEQAAREEEQRRAEEEHRKRQPAHEFSLNDEAAQAARRDLDKGSRLAQEQKLSSTYTASYTPYKYTPLIKCPPNQFYAHHSYVHDPASSTRVNNSTVPRDLTNLQDGWSKSLAVKRFHSSYDTRMKDLRENHSSGKKIVKDSPMNAHKYV